MKTPLPCSASLTRTLLALSAASFGFVALASADVVGSGHVISETRSVSGFHGVDLRGSGDVIVTQGDSEGLVIEAEDNLLPLIESEVESNGILRLGFKPHSGHIESSKEVVYKLSVKALDKLAVEGSGTIRAAALSADHPDVMMAGSGNISVDSLKADAVTTAVNGSGTVKLAGEAHKQNAAINGSGEYEAKNLKTADASVEINGSGESSVAASGSLAVTINGSGEVGYAGTPTVTKVVHGSGEVHPLGAKNDD